MSTSLAKVFGDFRVGGKGEESHWLSVSDLMAGLMMVFLFIAVVLMRSALLETERIRDVAVAYQDTMVAIFDSLMEEFADDLDSWDADIDRDTLTFNFQSPEVLFASGASDIQPRFQEVLADFFPRYMTVLQNYRQAIDEVRIEGHTSSLWMGAATPSEAYFFNMDLSQRRTREVLRFVYDMPSSDPYRDWVRQNFAAVGFSSGRLIMTPEGFEDEERSRRVGFRIVTNADIQIRRILELD